MSSEFKLGNVYSFVYANGSKAGKSRPVKITAVDTGIVKGIDLSEPEWKNIRQYQAKLISQQILQADESCELVFFKEFINYDQELSYISAVAIYKILFPNRLVIRGNQSYLVVKKEFANKVEFYSKGKVSKLKITNDKGATLEFDFDNLSTLDFDASYVLDADSIEKVLKIFGESNVGSADKAAKVQSPATQTPWVNSVGTILRSTDPLGYDYATPPILNAWSDKKY